LPVTAAMATAKRLIWASVFRFATEDLFLTHIRSCPVFLKRGKRVPLNLFVILIMLHLQKSKMSWQKYRKANFIFAWSTVL